MKCFSIKWVFIFTLIHLLLWAIGAYMFTHRFSEKSFPAYNAIPIAYWMFYMLFVALTYYHYSRDKFFKWHQFYFVMKMCKMLVFLFSALFYAIVTHIQVPAFLITFILYYLATLAVESLYIYRFEKKMKKLGRTGDK